VAIARPFNVHGPGEPRGSFTAEVIAQLAQAHESPVIVRVLETDSVRDFVDVEDVARALLLMAGESGMSGPYNIGTGRGTSLLEYLGIASQAAGVDMRVETTRDDLLGTVSVADCERLRAFGWQPLRGIEDTVSRQLRVARMSIEGRS
jgi:nucleoside-diphosphate-sugar epimerase